MHFMGTADTDIGISKNRNQDSVLIKHAAFDGGEVMMSIICDGMGGLDKGELASATVIRRFSEWFDKELPFELEHVDMNVIGGKWSFMLKDLNMALLEYSRLHGESMGTTFTGVLFVEEQYVAVHVGDSRLYRIGSAIHQITQDQTFVAREVRRGAMTWEQARVDRRRNMLLQCIGASDIVHPEILSGNTERGVYMLCSDGFRHEITEEEIFEQLNSYQLPDQNAMHRNAGYLIDQVKRRQERDNISVIVIKVE